MTDILILGEAWGEEELRQRTPFVGASGWHLTLMLQEAGIHRADCYLTNVFNLKPGDTPKKKNDLSTLHGYPSLKGWPKLEGGYIHEEYRKELERLADELTEVNPNLIVALGNTAIWALCGTTGISKLRGTTTISSHTVAGYKLLPTYHPAYVLRNWSDRPIVIADLIKAKRESAYPDIRRPKREIWIEPTLEDLYEFDQRYITPADRLGVDIETAGNQVTCIGFSPNPNCALVVPFFDARKASRSYWPTLRDEKDAWRFVSDVCSRERPTKTFQNGLYDIAFLWRAYKIKTINAEHDTMLLHHALQPESLKGLGFLGSVYTDEGPWKQLRHQATIKRDD